MLKIGDKVYVQSNGRAGTVDKIVFPTVIVKYKDGEKEKIIVTDITKITDECITITPEDYDLAVKEIMYEAAADYEGQDQTELDSILEMIGVICSTLKRRVFAEND